MRPFLPCAALIAAACTLNGPVAPLTAASVVPRLVATPSSQTMTETYPQAALRSGIYLTTGAPVRPKLKHHAGNPAARGSVETYLLLPGVGTVVVSVTSDGKATIAPVPVHLNESNFTVESRRLPLKAVRFVGGARTHRLSPTSSPAQGRV